MDVGQKENKTAYNPIEGRLTSNLTKSKRFRVGYFMDSSFFLNNGWSKAKFYILFFFSLSSFYFMSQFHRTFVGQSPNMISELYFFISFTFNCRRQM